MSPTHVPSLDCILGLNDLTIINVQSNGPVIHVWAQPKHRPKCMYCQQEGLRIKATYERRLKHTCQGNGLM